MRFVLLSFRDFEGEDVLIPSYQTVSSRAPYEKILPLTQDLGEGWGRDEVQTDGSKFHFRWVLSAEERCEKKWLGMGNVEIRPPKNGDGPIGPILKHLPATPALKDSHNSVRSETSEAGGRESIRRLAVPNLFLKRFQWFHT